MTTEDKLKALDKVIANIEKIYGKNSNIIRSKDDGVIFIPRLKSSSPGISYVCGGGYPKGRIIEIYGPESSGKTSLAILACIDSQREGGLVGYVDAECAFDYEYAERLGLDTDSKKFRLIQPDFGEQALDLVEQFVTNKIFDIIVVDSVAALVPKAEIDGAMGDSHMGLQARLMGQAMRKITPKLLDSEVILIFINQIRMKIGVVFGNPETTTGGRALRFYSSIRLDVRRIECLGPAENPTGIKIKIKGKKNKTAPPFCKAEIELDHKKGFNTTKEYLDLAVSCKAIGKAGSWYSYGTEKIGQGRDNACKFLNNNPEIFSKIKLKVDQFILGTSELEDKKPKDNSFKEMSKELKEDEKLIRKSNK